MFEIPLVVEELYYHMAHVPPKDAWPEEYSRLPEKEAEKLYMFFQGLRLGLRLREACRD